MITYMLFFLLQTLAAKVLAAWQEAMSAADVRLIPIDIRSDQKWIRKDKI